MDITTLTIIAGSVALTVQLRDGSHKEVKVRQVSVRELATYVEIQAREPELVEWICGESEGFADQLVVESYERIVEVAHALNDPTFDRWAERQVQLVGQLEAQDGPVQKLQKMNQKALASGISAHGTGSTPVGGPKTSST